MSKTEKSETPKANATPKPRTPPLVIPSLPPGAGLHSHEITMNRQEYFFGNALAGTTQHDVMNGEFWRHYTAGLKRNDVLHVLVDGDDGEPQRWEMVLNVEASAPNFEVSLRARYGRKPPSLDAMQLSTGEYIQLYRGGDGRHKGYTVFRADGKPGPITNHRTRELAFRQWDRERPRAV